MKTIQINLDEKEYELVNKKKGTMTWRDFLLQAKVN